MRENCGVTGGFIRYLRHTHCLCAAIGLVLIASLAPARLSAQPSLSSDTSIAAEGYFVLTWVTDETASSYYLQQSTTPAFNSPQSWEVAGSGSRTVTGLEDGDYHYRILAGGDPLASVNVTVRHHSLQRAGMVFALGLLLFATLVVSIVIGSRLHEQEADHA